jgi:predicted transcriptional regulator
VRPSKRAWVDIIADILENAQEGENITSIMYMTRLSYGHMKEYLKMLTDGGLLAYEQNDRVSYRTTEKGFEYLETYRRLVGIISVGPRGTGKGLVPSMVSGKR